jgi:thymidylate synthase (FAD)
MGQASLKVSCIAHTQLEREFAIDNEWDACVNNFGYKADDAKAVALTAIRTCYSPNKPSYIFDIEGGKYFRNAATDGEGGTEADRLFRHITRSGHTSTLEHITYTFAVEGLSRVALAQLTRHRVGFSYSVQSQRYVKFGSDDKSGGFDYIVPPSVVGKKIERGGNIFAVEELFVFFMEMIQEYYDTLREAGVPAEDARMLLPNAAATNLTLTANLRALLDFYSKRKKGRGAQWEIADLAEQLRKEVERVNPWTAAYFDAA